MATTTATWRQPEAEPGKLSAKLTFLQQTGSMRIAALCAQRRTVPAMPLKLLGEGPRNRGILMVFRLAVI